MKNFLINLRNKNFPLKVLSLIFAILLWSYVKSEIDPTRKVTFKNINIKYYNIAELKKNNLTLIEKENPVVDVTVEGKESSMNFFQKDDITASVNLLGLQAGDYDLPIEIKINTAGVQLKREMPNSLSVQIDNDISKMMNVDIKVIGELPPKYILGKIKKQEKVIVKGPETYVNSIQKIEAEIDITGKKESMVFSTKVVPFNKKNEVINDIKINPEKINIEVPILKTETVPIKLNLAGEGLIDINDIKINPSVVAIEGNSSIINKVNEIWTKPMTYNQLVKGNTKLELDLPTGVILVDKDFKFNVELK